MTVQTGSLDALFCATPDNCNRFVLVFVIFLLLLQGVIMLTNSQMIIYLYCLLKKWLLLQSKVSTTKPVSSTGFA